MQPPISLDAVRSVVRALTEYSGETSGREAPARSPIVTISRESGIDASIVTAPLIERLSAADEGEQPWIEYDRSLVERVAADHNISQDLVESLDERDKSWFEHLVAGLSGSATGTDVAMKTARTIRALAHAGRAVIVGRGGQCILSGMRNVINVRLVAPFDWRVEQYVAAEGMSARDAESAVRDLDAQKAHFLRNHFNHDMDDIALYDVLINVARTGGDLAAHMITEMVARRALSASP